MIKLKINWVSVNAKTNLFTLCLMLGQMLNRPNDNYLWLQSKYNIFLKYFVENNIQVRNVGRKNKKKERSKKMKCTYKILYIKICLVWFLKTKTVLFWKTKLKDKNLKFPDNLKNHRINYCDNQNFSSKSSQIVHLGQDTLY